MEPIAVTAGEAALSVAFEAILGKLSSQDFLENSRMLNPGVRQWSEFLSTMKPVLNDAEERQMSDRPIRLWFDDLRDLAYDVEDILDVVSTEVMREKVMAEVRKLIPTCCSYFKFSGSLGLKVAEITHRFKTLAEEKEKLNLTERAAGVVTERLETTCLVQESQVYGRQEDKKTLVSELLRSDSNGNPVSVVAIVGMGGLGKTTLAQLLYNDETVRRSFDIKAWVCVSDEFDVFKISVKIIENFTSSFCDMKDLNNVQKKLIGMLHGKKYLLVLDDVWNENYLEWDALRQPLAGGGLGSKVLITTRSEYVANVAGSEFTYRLMKLKPKDCLSILARHALEENDFSGHPLLKEIGEEIAKKCHGLPLAAKAIGGLLRATPNGTGWSNVLKSNMWELPLDQCPIMPALSVSYHCLPSHLKRCFAYCAIFPKDYVFDKDDLILLWKAEGFLEQSQSTDFMELGNEYFQDLLSRSFFQPSPEYDSKFVMLNLMNDLVMWISRGICFHLTHDKEIASSLKFENLRHLSFVSHDNEDVQRFKKFSSSTKLRTFIACRGFRHFIMKINAIFGNIIVHTIRLKVLCLSGYDIEELPDSISKLKLLRHLDISFTNIQILPESISDLLNLQILKLNGCHSLIQLPQGIRKLINLQLFDISETNALKRMPSGIDRLTNLQFLPKFIVGENHGLRLKELQRLSLIRGELSILRLEHVNYIQDAREANLKAKEGLVSLKFQWSANLRALEEEKHEQILDELRPHTSLKSLEIKGYNGKYLPRWVGDSNFTNLETLTLRDCNGVSSLLLFEGLSYLKTLNIRCSSLTNLPNELPSLETLRIERCSNLTNLSDELPSLTRLTIEECSNLKNLPNELPSLTRLSIGRCSNLISLPYQLPSLEILSIKGCSNLISLPDQLPSLETLSIKGCSNLTNLPDQLPLLIYLSIKECSNLINLCDQLPSLIYLSIEGCSELTNLPKQPSSLEIMYIEGCSNLPYKLWSRRSN